MIVPMILKVLGGFSAAAIVGATAFAVIPPSLTPPTGLWLDAPADGSVIPEQQVTVTMHSDRTGVSVIQAVISQDGARVATITDTHLELTARGAKAVPLSWADPQWSPKPGIYQLQVRACATDACLKNGVFTEDGWIIGPTATITVVEQAPVFVDTAEGTWSPGSEPEAPPIEEPDPGVTGEPDPGESDPDPQPDPDVTPSGVITQNFTDSALITTWFEVDGVTPGTTKVSVRVQVVPAGSGYDESSWTTLKCTPVTSGSCTTDQFEAGLGGGAARWGYYQLVLKNGSNVVEGDVKFWELLR